MEFRGLIELDEGEDPSLNEMKFGIYFDFFVGLQTLLKLLMPIHICKNYKSISNLMFNRCDEKWKQSVIFGNIFQPSFICPLLWLILIWKLLWFIDGLQPFEKAIFWWIRHYKGLMVWLFTSDWHCLPYLQVDLAISKIWVFFCQFSSAIASVALHFCHWRYIWIINFLLIVHLWDSFVGELQLNFWFSYILFFWSFSLTFSPVTCFGSLRVTYFLNYWLGWRIHLR